MMQRQTTYNYAPNERVYLVELVRTGLILLVVSVVCSVSATWLTTKHLPDAVLYPALIKAFAFPWLIVPLCTFIVARVSLKNWRNMVEYMRLAFTDEMTGLANRRAFMNEAQRLFADVEERDDNLSLFIIDLDFFKQINDRYGHDAGDAALIQAADQIEGTVPPDCTVARLGGEEFAVIMHYKTLNEVHATAEAIRSAIALNPCRYQKSLISLTASIGVSLIGKGDTVRIALTRADSALYEAKAAGRNRLIIAA